jgi:hypothetical protein
VYIKPLNFFDNIGDTSLSFTTLLPLTLGEGSQHTCTSSHTQWKTTDPDYVKWLSAGVVPLGIPWFLINSLVDAAMIHFSAEASSLVLDNFHARILGVLDNHPLDSWSSSMFHITELLVIKWL